MRQKHAKAAEPRTRRQEPLTEGPQKKGTRRGFTDTEVAHIKKRWKEVAAEGRNNNEIAMEIAGSIGRTQSSVYCKIKRLISEGELEKNPNQRKSAAVKRFTESEIDQIKKRYRELFAEGKNNWQISIDIGNSLGRISDSIGDKLRDLIKKGELEENPNQKRTYRKFTEAEIGFIKETRETLAAEGKLDKHIAGKLAEKLGRSVGSLITRIGRLVKDGELERNPNARRAHGFFSKMNDDNFVRYVKKIMKENRITRRVDLEDGDPGLYDALLKREKKNPGIMDRIGFEVVQRDWSSMNDDEFVGHIKRFMGENSITRRRQLEKANPRLYGALRRREIKDPSITGMIEFETVKRDWSSMDDDEFVEHVVDFMAEKGITRVGELKDTCQALLSELYRRNRKNPGIVERIGFEKQRRDWNPMTDDEVVAHAQTFARERGITRRKQLENADVGLYIVLVRRKLVDRVFAEIEAEQAQLQEDRLLSDIRECFDAYTGDAP